MKNSFLTFSLLIALAFSSLSSKAHCEVPCGIFEDSLRIALIYEDITTIEKSMVMIQKLEAEEKTNYNQLVRWINTKEEHANKIQDLATQYFMFQRVKPADETEKEMYETYIEQLTALHEIAIYAMKAKQSTDLVYIKKLKEAVHDFEHSYFEEHEH